jgi:hypothetical protein
MTVELKIDPAALRLLTSHTSDLFKTMFSAGEQIRVLTAARTNRRSGLLAESIRSEISTSDMDEGTITVEVGTPVPYAHYYADGTPPHVIVPKRAKALRFVSGGQVIFTQKVQHPGTQPHTFLAESLTVIATRVLGVEPTITARGGSTP